MVFLEMCESVNAEFEHDRGYMGIEFEIPYEYLGDLGVGMSIEAIETSGPIRLKRGAHG